MLGPLLEAAEVCSLLADLYALARLGHAASDSAEPGTGELSRVVSNAAFWCQSARLAFRPVLHKAPAGSISAAELDASRLCCSGPLLACEGCAKLASSSAGSSAHTWTRSCGTQL